MGDEQVFAAETRRGALKEMVRRLKEASLDTPVLDARLLVQHALGVGWDELFLAPDRPLAPAERDVLVDALARRTRSEPVSRITGHRHFWTLDLLVTPATLDPRPDTESVIEAVLAALPDRNQPFRLLDLGTGTGAILLALLSELPQATGVGVDRSAKAAEVARANAERLGLGGRAAIVVGDWADALGARFDIVVSNPPYIPAGDLAGLPRDVREYDPIGALDGGADGLDAYRRIGRALPELLAAGGLAALEIGQGQAEAVGAIMAQEGLTTVAIRPDLAGISRCLVLKPDSR